MRGGHRAGLAAQRSDLAQALEEIFAFGDSPGLVDLGMAHDALGVEQKHRALVHAAFLVEHAVGLAYRAMRPVIREQRERQSAQLFGPGLEAGKGIGADLQDFDAQLLEFIVVLTEPADLILSPAGKSKRQE